MGKNLPREYLALGVSLLVFLAGLSKKASRQGEEVASKATTVVKSETQTNAKEKEERSPGEEKENPPESKQKEENSAKEEKEEKKEEKKEKAPEKKEEAKKQEKKNRVREEKKAVAKKKKKKKRVVKRKEKERDGSLEGVREASVVCSERECVLWIGGRKYRRGDAVGGWRIVAVSLEWVDLERGGKRVRVSLR